MIKYRSQPPRRQLVETVVAEREQSSRRNNKNMPYRRPCRAWGLFAVDIHQEEHFMRAAARSSEQILAEIDEADELHYIQYVVAKTDVHAM